MRSLRNKVTLIGRLGKEPEIRTTDNNIKFVKFTLATNDEYINKDGEKAREAQWHNIAVWGTLTDVCEKFLTKGREVVIEGRLTYRSWDDKQGIKHYVTEIIASDILLVGNSEK